MVSLAEQQQQQSLLVTNMPLSSVLLIISYFLMKYMHLYILEKLLY
jgi:hypothetical protein